MTRRSSVRAQAQEFYREMVRDADDRGSLTQVTPTPDPSPRFARARGGGEESVQGEGVTNLTARVRALYEGSAVPVREIAALAGVSERTLYKYVAKHGWRKRYARVPRGLAAAAANRGRRLQPSPGFAPAKGAGGRFIRREDKDRPFAAGLKALDAAGERQAAAACGEAERRARVAEADAQAERWGAELSRAIQAVREARDELAAHEAAHPQQFTWLPPVVSRKRALTLAVHVALDRMKLAVVQWEKAVMVAWEKAALATRFPAPREAVGR